MWRWRQRHSQTRGAPRSWDPPEAGRGRRSLPSLPTDGPCQHLDLSSRLQTEREQISVALSPSVCGRWYEDSTRDCQRWLQGAGPGGEGEVRRGQEFRMLISPSPPHGRSQLHQCQGTAGVQGVLIRNQSPAARHVGSTCVPETPMPWFCPLPQTHLSVLPPPRRHARPRPSTPVHARPASPVHFWARRGCA